MDVRVEVQLKWRMEMKWTGRCEVSEKARGSDLSKTDILLCYDSGTASFSLDTSAPLGDPAS